MGATHQKSSGASITMTAVVANSSGLNHLSDLHFRVVTRITWADPCHVVYTHATNSLNLVNDTGQAMVSAGLALGAAGTLANSRCSVNPAAATKQIANGILTVNVPVTFVPEKMAGERYFYVNAFNDEGKLTHWVIGGIFTVE